MSEIFLYADETGALDMSGSKSGVHAKNDSRPTRNQVFELIKEIARQVSKPGDTLYVAIGSLQTHNKRDAIRLALEDVCSQAGHDRRIVPCIWDAASSWGIQVADYGLWATQPVLAGRWCSWFGPCIEPTLESAFTPWGRSQ